MVWYRTANETDNDDGEHIAYLRSDDRSSAYFRELDPDLYERLGRVVAGERSTAGLASAGLLDAGTRFFSDLLDFADLPVTARTARLEWRRSWVARALAATDGCEIVFADPDNGIRSTGHMSPSYRTKAVKYAYLDELAAFAAQGQSLVVHHHADRSASVEVQARRRLADIVREVPIEPVAAVRASRGTTRLFLVAADAAHAGYLADRLTALADSPWDRELEVYWS